MSFLCVHCILIFQNNKEFLFAGKWSYLKQPALRAKWENYDKHVLQHFLDIFLIFNLFICFILLYNFHVIFCSRWFDKFSEELSHEFFRRMAYPWHRSSFRHRYANEFHWISGTNGSSCLQSEEFRKSNGKYRRVFF